MEGQAALAVDLVEQASTEFHGRWDRLVSTTNWEKGRIIRDWRAALLAAGAGPPACSDETWSRLVGGVSSQHVGRLRRTFERFGDVHDQYAGLYWSHFQAALDWHDAEMWLEGAVQNGWSISQMRYQRWEALGGPADQRPSDQDIVVSEVDEDFVPLVEDVAERGGEGADRSVETSDDEDLRGRVEPAEAMPFDGSIDPRVDAAPAPFRPFEHLAELPDDLAEAFESMKLAIVRHKLAGWRDISRDDLLASLDALKSLALAPADNAWSS
jgi:hypothetical protein